MRTGSLIIVSLLCAVGAAAQDNNKITVPLSNPSQPATIKANLLHASITIVAGTGHDVVITPSDGSLHGARSVQTPPPGMHQIGGTGFDVDVEEDHNIVTISHGMTVGHLNIETPANTNLQIKTTNGRAIEVTGISGDLEVDNVNGSITMNNVSGSVVAHTVNGPVKVSFDRIAGNKPMSFVSLNGQVDVTLPSDAKARLHMKTDHGAIFSDFDVKLEASANSSTPRNTGATNARYRISAEKTMVGTINGGGPEYSFQTMNGNILIHRK